MPKVDEKYERERRAERLVLARKRAGFAGPTRVAEATGISVNNVKAHEAGRNGFGMADAKAYAATFGVPLRWLYFAEGSIDDVADEPSGTVVTDAPLISWVSAGELADQDAIVDFSDFPSISTVDLPDGEWIALRVENNSMNKISPPESVIFVNRRDKRLVANACYIIADEQGRATYKRYRPNAKPQFQPVSYEDVDPPKLEGAITIVGRVRRSMIDM